MKHVRNVLILIGGITALALVGSVIVDSYPTSALSMWLNSDSSTIFNPKAETQLLNYTFQGQTSTLGDIIETDFGYQNWIGSNSYPGTFQVTSASHGASDVYWTLTMRKGGMLEELVNQQSMIGNGYTMEFEVTQDGKHIYATNKTSQFVLFFGVAASAN